MDLKSKIFLYGFGILILTDFSFMIINLDYIIGLCCFIITGFIVGFFARYIYNEVIPNRAVLISESYLKGYFNGIAFEKNINNDMTKLKDKLLKENEEIRNKREKEKYKR